MKTSITLLLALALWPVPSRAGEKKPGPDAVVVKTIDAPLPHEEAKRGPFLWETFANKPEEERFESYGTERWKETFALFAKALVGKADEQHLGSAALHKALQLVLKHADAEGDAYLPVGAYQTTLDGKPIWIITVKWEYPSMGELGHIRMFAFDQKTLAQVGFETCM